MGETTYTGEDFFAGDVLHYNKHHVHVPCSINERVNSCTHIGSCLAATASCAKWCTSIEHTGTSVLHFSHIRWRMSIELSHVSASICKWDSLIWSSWSKTSSAVSSWTQSSKREAGVGFLSPACFGTFRTSFRDFGSPSSTTVDCFWLALRFLSIFTSLTLNSALQIRFYAGYRYMYACKSFHVAVGVLLMEIVSITWLWTRWSCCWYCQRSTSSTWASSPGWMWRVGRCVLQPDRIPLLHGLYKEEGGLGSFMLCCTSTVGCALQLSQLGSSHCLQ